MYWKKFKSLPAEEKTDEIYFILGLDLGNETSAMACYNTKSQAAEVIDLSGGYGKPSVPTAMQYIHETKEWVFGEYAILNKNSPKDITVTSLIERLGRKEYVEIESRPVSIVNILSFFLKELISNVKNINPRAEIAGIVVSTPSYLSAEARDELMLAFKNAGYSKELISLTPDRECIFTQYYLTNPVEKEKIILLDFGSRELRGGIYSIEPSGDSEFIKAVSISTFFDNNIGVNSINNAVLDLFCDYYCSHVSERESKLTDFTRSQISSFTYQHRDLLFQKSIYQKPVRLYFNFAYPPFQKSIAKSDVDMLLEPFLQQFRNFMARLLGAKTASPSSKPATDNISAVLCVGGGFEMLWAREVITAMFPESQIVFYKNSKSVIANGAASYAAVTLEAVEGKRFIIEDNSQIKSDIGLMLKKDKRKRFVPVVERHSFWWQSHPPKMIILDESTGNDVDLELFRRDSYGELLFLHSITLKDLPERPRGTTRLKLNLQFEKAGELTATVSDCGFGELFPKADYERTAVVQI